jgi:hypothetical protein
MLSTNIKFLPNKMLIDIKKKKEYINYKINTFDQFYKKNKSRVFIPQSVLKYVEC